MKTKMTGTVVPDEISSNFETRIGKMTDWTEQIRFEIRRKKLLSKKRGSGSRLFLPRGAQVLITLRTKLCLSFPLISNSLNKYCSVIRRN